MKNYIVLDIEANGFNPTKIYCVCVKTNNTNPICFTEDNQEEFENWLSNKENHVLVGHNIIKYDLKQIERVWGFKFDNEVYDTLIHSRIIAPGIEGGHSLKIWGQRLMFKKGEMNDFSVFDPKMIDYCKNDVLLNEKLYKFILDIYKSI